MQIRGLAAAGSWHSSLRNQLPSQLPCKEPSLVSIVRGPTLKQGQSLLASPIFSSWGLLFPFPYQSGKATWELLSVDLTVAQLLAGVWVVILHNQSFLLRAQALSDLYLPSFLTAWTWSNHCCQADQRADPFYKGQCSGSVTSGSL